MFTERVNLLYYSPTGGTKRVVDAIAEGLGIKERTDMEFTTPAQRKIKQSDFTGITIMACPVYHGRIPKDAAAYLSTLRADKTPVIPVVVYGNYDYGDALKELHDIAVDAGFTPLAAGAFIAEHSFSTKGINIAFGRPDGLDFYDCSNFGSQIAELLEKTEGLKRVATLGIPGSKPYQKPSFFPRITPQTDLNLCACCGLCAQACPTGAIDITDYPVSDKKICLSCNACIQVCPNNARAFHDPIILAVRCVLSFVLCHNRKKPKTFLPRI